MILWDRRRGGAQRHPVQSIEGDDRWLDLRQHHLIEYVFEAGEARTGPLTFDVPADATELKLTLKGTDETIDLGF